MQIQDTTTYTVAQTQTFGTLALNLPYYSKQNDKNGNSAFLQKSTTRNSHWLPNEFGP